MATKKSPHLTPEPSMDWLANHEAAVKMALSIEAYWAKEGAPWVRASVVSRADKNTYEVRTNLINGSPPPRPLRVVNRL